jgi:hypothetical protein
MYTNVKEDNIIWLYFSTGPQNGLRARPSVLVPESLPDYQNFATDIKAASYAVESPSRLLAISCGSRELGCSNRRGNPGVSSY